MYTKFEGGKIAIRVGRGGGALVLCRIEGPMAIKACTIINFLMLYSPLGVVSASFAQSVPPA